MARPLDRAAVLGDPQLRGRALCRAYAGLIDGWIASLFAQAGPPRGLALVAVGGYGRGELAPGSDLDLLLLHDGKVRDTVVKEIAEQLWYPVWDEGLKLGHAVRTPKEALRLAADDLDTATSLLSVRLLAGDEALAADTAERAAALWRKRSRRWLDELSNRVKQRHAEAGEVAFLLEPDIKNGRGGLRDVHAIAWAEAAESVMLEGDHELLAAAEDVLLDVRVSLHRRTGRAGDRLLFEEQDGIAEELGYPDADDLMQAVAAAARDIAWASDETWFRVDSSLQGPRTLRLSRDRPVADGVVLREGTVLLTATADPAADPLLALRAAVGAAAHDTRIERRSLDRLAAETPTGPFPWSEEARALLAELLLTGPRATGVIEALDRRGLWVRVLPEWEPVRCKPQRNAYHTFTVDRHLCEAAANAAGLADRVARPDLLVVGTLLHDIGKGYPGDHIEVGIGLVRAIGTRMGYPEADVDVLCELVRLHLLLPDVATRRDLDDEGTLRLVADEVGTVEVLDLLAALTEADSIATGPAAWNAWKAELLAELVARTRHLLGGGAVEQVLGDRFPTEEQLALLAAGETVVRGTDDELTVVSPDRPGLFSKVAGVLALNGLDVLGAAATTDEAGMALEVLRVESSFGPVVNWDKVAADLDAALAGRLALGARLADRARTYRRAGPPGPPAAPPEVRIDNDTSHRSTVVEVHAADRVGLLYRVTQAIAELQLDIRSAKVQTMGRQVVDSFYVRDMSGRKLTDADLLDELRRAILHALAD